MCLSWGLLNLLNSLRILKHSCLNNLVFPFSHDTPGIGKQFRTSRKLCAVLQMASYLCFLVADLLVSRMGEKTKELQSSHFKSNTQKGHTSFPLTFLFSRP